MKFSEIEASGWTELKPYLDTCLLPLTGLTGAEEPWEVTERLEALRDVLEWVEIPFKGRVVTYPAFHFTLQDEGTMAAELNSLCERIKKTGFKYVILMSTESVHSRLTIHAADLMICEPIHPELDMKEKSRAVSRLVQEMWKANID